MAIDKLSDILTTQGHTLTTISELNPRPMKTAADLQADFDKNAQNLLEAIDGNDDHAGLIASIQENITHAGGGDMSTTQYATGENPSSSEYPVDRALYSTQAYADENGQRITTTYLPKSGGSANRITGDLYVDGKIVTGVSPTVKTTTTSTSPTTGTWVTLESMSLAAGTYIIVGTVIYRSANDGNIYVRINGAGSVYYAYNCGRLPANNNATGGIQVVLITAPSATTTFSLDVQAAQAYTVPQRNFRAMRVG